MSKEETLALRLALLANGYTPIPNVGKTTFLKGWPTIKVDEAEIRGWSRRHSRWQDTGLRIQDGLAVIDIDINHEVIDRVAARLEKEEPALAQALVRYGKGRKEAWFVRTAEDFGRIATRRWLAPGANLDRDGTHVVEIFGGSSPRQFGAFGAHTRGAGGDVEIAYEWAIPYHTTVAESPANVRLDQLPELPKNVFLRLCDVVEEELEAAGWTPVMRTVKGEGDALRVYDLQPEMHFECNDGLTRTLAELEAAAGEEGLRCSASWLEPGGNHSMTRCLIGRSHSGVLTLWDSATGTTHLPASKAPSENSAATQEAVAGLLAKLQKAADSEAKQKRRSRLTAEDDYQQAAAKLLATYAYCPSRQAAIVPLYATSATEGMTMTNFRTMLLPWAGEEEGPKGGIKKINPADIWASSSNRETVEGLRLRPDRERPTYTEEGKTYVNIYAPELHLRAGGDAAPGLEFLEQLLPDSGEREWFTRWLAFKYRNPGVPGPAVVMVARSHGTGRGTLGELVRRLFGARYVKTLGFDLFAGRTYQSQYTAWMADSLVVIVNESSTADNGSTYRTKHDTYERLKEVIEPRAQERRIVMHGVTAFDALVFTSYLIFTNNPDALPLPADDRRIWVGSNGEPRPVEYWEGVNAWMGEPANVDAFAQHLLALDLGDYSPYAVPPMTEGKEAMTEMSRSDLDRGIERALAKLTDGELFVPAQVIALIQEMKETDGLRLPDKWQDSVGRELPKLTHRVGKPNGRNWHPMIEGKRHSIYAIQRTTAQRWNDAEADDVRSEILRNGSVKATGMAGDVLRGIAKLQAIRGGKD